MSNIHYPLPYWWDYTVSGQQLPDFYWNVKSQEERIKKICEDLWKLIELYKMLVDAINDHEERISTLEAQMQWVLEQINKLYELYNELVDEINHIYEIINDLETRVETIEHILDDLDLEDIVARISALEQSVADILLALNDKMDKQPSAVEGNVGKFDANGQIIDGGVALSDLLTQADVSNKMDKQPSAVQDNLGKFDANGQIVDSGVALGDIVVEPTTPIPDGYILISDNNVYASSGLLFSERYIEAQDEQAALALSQVKTLSLIYTEEVV